MGLFEAYDEDQLFSFDFSQNTRVPRLPEFADWAKQSGDIPTIFFDKALCQAMVQEIGPQLEGQIPVSRGQGFGGRVGAAFLPSFISALKCSPSYSPHLGASGFSPGAGRFLPAHAEPCLGWVGRQCLGQGTRPGRWESAAAGVAVPSRAKRSVEAPDDVPLLP